MKFIFLLALFFSGNVLADFPRVHFVGDSLCAWRNYKKMVPMTSDCKAGRALVEYDGDNRSKDILFIELATNDIYRKISTRQYRKHLKKLLRKSPKYTVCILPLNIPDRDSHPHRKIMKRYCPVSVSPYEYGVIADMPDGIHWSPANDRRMANLINQQIINYMVFK